MPYRHETCKAGRTKQHTYYYATRTDTKEGSRRQKENKTSEAQKKVNSRQAVKKLTWILNENYDGTSLYITWSYAKEKRPAGKEELRADVDKLLRDIRKEYKAAGDVAKYVWAAEVAAGVIVKGAEDGEAYITIEDVPDRHRAATIAALEAEGYDKYGEPIE